MNFILNSARFKAGATENSFLYSNPAITILICKQKMLKKIFLILLLIGSCGAFVEAQKTALVVSKNSAIDTRLELRRASFIRVWETVNEKHFDPTFGGVDWRKMREIYEPKALAAKTDAEFYIVVQQMLNELGQSHFAILPPKKNTAKKTAAEKSTEKKPEKAAGVKDSKKVVEPEKKSVGKETDKVAEKDSEKVTEPEKTSEESDETENIQDEESDEPEKGTIGVSIKIIENKAIVLRVLPDSPAAKAGIKIGFAIEKINDSAVADILTEIDETRDFSRETAAGKQFTREQILNYWLNGEPETAIHLEVLNEKNLPQKFNLTRTAEKREYSLPLGNVPKQPLEFETRRLENNVGYIRFNAWSMPLLPKIKAAVREMADAQGIVFDIRRNPGGLGFLATSVSSLLVNEKISLGTFKSRVSEEKFNVFPSVNAFRGRVVVLIDGGSASTSEVFAAGLQETGRARVVGETSMGAVLLSLFDRLPIGARFQYAVSDYKSPKNILIEGRGVKPDVEIKMTRANLLAGRDVQLETAVGEILKK